jgi:hypothetical protein
MITISQIRQLIHNYAPELDTEKLLQFSEFIYGEFRDESNLDDLNLSHQWHNYNRRVN